MGIVLSGTEQQKSFMSPEELVKKLANKGVTFNHDYTQERAIDYLKKNNNYYKLSSYRKNFTKDDDGKYIDLDFSYLVDMGIIDMLFRYQVMRMALDIEHFEKVKLLTVLKNKNDNGYSALASYKAALETQTNIGTEGFNKLDELEKEIEHNKSSILPGYADTHPDRSGNACLGVLGGYHVWPTEIFYGVLCKKLSGCSIIGRSLSTQVCKIH